MDGDALEAELKQVIGDTQHAFDITAGRCRLTLSDPR